MSQPVVLPSYHFISSQPVAATPVYVEHTTEAVRPEERLAFWRDSVLRRMEPAMPPGAAVAFNGRLRVLHGDNAVLVDHASDGVIASRSRERASRDGGDEIGLDVMVHCEKALLDHGGEREVLTGELRFIDYTLPSRVSRSRHRAIGLMLPRCAVRDIVGPALNGLAGRAVPMTGLAVLLAQHLTTSMNEAPQMTSLEQVLAVNMAAQLALAVLQGAWREVRDFGSLDQGLSAAARRVITRDCHDPDLTPAKVAAVLGCSRASLYRAFAPGAVSVAETIWGARLELASRLLRSAAHQDLLLSEIAHRCGFVDQTGFSRMFKQRFGTTPSEARAVVAPRRREGSGRRAAG